LTGQTGWPYVSGMIELLTEIEAFCKAHNMAETTFSRKAIGYPHLVWRLRDGVEISRANEAKARAFMAEYQPAQAA
jgi:hypothetical protein